MHHRRAMLKAMSAATLAAPAALAQPAWPERPLRIIVPFPPGQSTDIVPRLVADELCRRWPQRGVVENRAGGAGVAALEAGAGSPADGYMLIAGSTGPLAVNPAVMQHVPYDPQRDFAAITNLVQVPLALVAHPSLPANTPEELVTLARSRTIDLATAGPASAAHMMADSASAPPNIRAGRLKAVAVASRARVPWLPETRMVAGSVSAGFAAFLRAELTQWREVARIAQVTL